MAGQNRNYVSKVCKKLILPKEPHMVLSFVKPNEKLGKKNIVSDLQTGELEEF